MAQLCKKSLKVEFNVLFRYENEIRATSMVYFKFTAPLLLRFTDFKARAAAARADDLGARALIDSLARQVIIEQC